MKNEVVIALVAYSFYEDQILYVKWFENQKVLYVVYFFKCQAKGETYSDFSGNPYFITEMCLLVY